jgi:DNA primase small subunit
LFARREFALTLEPQPGEEILIRYQSYHDKSSMSHIRNNAKNREADALDDNNINDDDGGGGGGEELRQAILKRKVTKIDIGAVFSHPPKDHKTKLQHQFQPVQRELVFDIDLTDYDSIRRCGCSGANICRVCWTFMSMAVQVVDTGLRDDFGFQHLLWVYSGRRGVHCWVCDENARQLSDEGRSAIAAYFDVRTYHKDHPS